MDKLEECLEAIRSDQMSQRKAAIHYEICISIVKNKLKNKFPTKPGNPNILTEIEERAFASHTVPPSEFGFPVDELDFR
jgi:hypothetical protein